MKLLFLTFVFVLTAVNSYAQKSEVFQKDGLAINGYDPVAFFRQSKAVKGATVYSLEWRDATWRFSSKENLDSFAQSPELYAPQYGGYCAFGMAEGHKAPTEPGTWSIVNGKLYFNYNIKVKQLWVKDTTAYIAKGDVNWPDIKDKE